MKIKCYFCGSDLDEGKIIANKKDIRHGCYGKNKRIVKCKKCGLVQLIPQWTNKELEDIYKDYSKQEDFKGYVPKPREYPKYIDKYLIKGEIILEVGCGFGNNIKRLEKEGYNICGIDKDSSVCDEKSIFNMDINELEKTEHNEAFDIIYGIHFLEHLKNPVKFLNNSYYALKNQGLLILEFPNVDEPLLTIWKNKEFFKYYWRPDHLFFYNKESILNLILKTEFKDFKIELKQKYGLWNHLNWVIRNKPSNINFNIPIIDNIYKFILTNIFHKSDSIILILRKKN